MKNILNKNGIIGVLDIGTYTTKCLLVRQGVNGKIDFLGHGLCKTSGISNSEIVNSEQVTETIKKAVEEAEKEANDKIENVIVSVSAKKIISTIKHLDKTLNDQIVTKQDIFRLQNKISNHIQSDNEKEKKVNLHTFFVCYSLDDRVLNNNIPINLSGEKLTMYYNSISADKFAIQDLKTCIERSHLTVSKFVAAPLMVGLATLKTEELKNGTLVIDFGAGSTGISYFYDNQNVFCKKIDFGSTNLSSRIAKELKITPLDAEDIKIKYGSCLNNQSYKDIEIKAYPIGIRDNTTLITTTKYAISEIIISEIDRFIKEIQDLIFKENIKNSISEIVLVGNGSKIEGFKERLSQELCNQNCRFGEPMHIPYGQKIIDSKIKDSFINCFGVVYYATHELLKNESTPKKGQKSEGKLQQIWNFFSNI